MPTVFVSHASSDAAFVQGELLPILKARRVEAWYSPHAIEGAVDWERAIKKGLEQSDWFMLVLSPAAVASEWVRTEVAWAFARRSGRIIPVSIDACDPTLLHLRLGELQFIDFRAHRRRGAQRLVEAIEVLRSSATTRVAAPPFSPPAGGPSASGSADHRQEAAAVSPMSRGWLAFAEPVDSRISVKGETHLFTIQARENDSLVFRLTNVDAEGGRPLRWVPCLEVFDSAGLSLAHSADMGRVSLGPLVATASGPMSLVISHNDVAGTDRHFEGTGGYRLVVQRLNNPSLSRSITAGETVRSRIDAKGTVHTFCIDLSVGDHLRVKMTRWGEDGVFPLLELYDPDGRPLDRAKGYEAAREPPPAAIDHRAQKIGQHVLLASAYIHYDTGMYELTVDIGDPEEVGPTLQDLSTVCAALPDSVTDVVSGAHAYVASSCRHFSRKVGAGFEEASDGPQLSVGDRLSILRSDGDYFVAEAYDGTVGYIGKAGTQEIDPKAYFAGSCAGKVVTGFLQGRGFVNTRIELATTAGSVELPMRRINILYATAETLRIFDTDDNEYVVDAQDCLEGRGGSPGRYVHGNWPGVKSGRGVVLWLSSDTMKRLGGSLILKRLKIVPP